MANKHPYRPLSSLVFRTPSFSILENFEQLLKSTMFQEAIFLASPSLYKECKQKDFKIEKLDEDEVKALYKYYIRSTNRCTPFGLFAGCSVGKLSTNTGVTLSNTSHWKRITRFDMNFLSTLVNKIENDSSIRSQLKFNLNTSIYQIGDKIRYIEYVYQGTERIHNIVCIEKNPYLDKVLEIAVKYVSINGIASLLLDDEVDMDIAVEFVEDLIESQVLRSELDIYVTGENILEKLIEQLSSLTQTESICLSLKKIAVIFSKIDRVSIGSAIPLYAEIIEEIKQLGIPFEEKFLFQVDLFKPVINAEIDAEIVNSFRNLLSLFYHISPHKKVHNQLDDFKKKFNERYEGQEVALVEVLDSDYGIGYGDSNPDIDFNILIKNINFPVLAQDDKEGLDLSKYYAEKTLADKWSNINEIDLSDVIIKKMNEDWSQSSDSLNISFSLIKNEVGDDLILFNEVWPNATYIFGRFCNLDSEIDCIVRQIADWEEKKEPDAILATVAHLPDSRIGNVLFRPNTIRKYEIPYLAKSSLPTDYQIPIADLLVTVKGNRIVLRSKKYQKEVIPKFDSVHNYNNNPTPIYRFLGDLQKRPSIKLELPNASFLSYFDYTPRIRYKNIILRKAQWTINLSEIRRKKVNTLIDFREYRLNRKIPRYISIAESDNILTIDCEQEISYNILMDYIKKNQTIQVEESFNYDKKHVVHGMNELPYMNEIILTFLRQ